MQERKFDKNQLIGFGLMLVLFFGYYLLTKPTEEEIQERRAQQEQLAKEQESANQEASGTAQVSDITNAPMQQDTLGERFIAEQNYILENEHLLLEFSNRGAQLTKVELKQFKSYDAVSENHEKPLYIIDGNNAEFGFRLTDTEGRSIDLAKRNFEVQQDGNSLVFSTQENGGIIQYIYSLNDTYDLSFHIKSQGLSNISNENQGEIYFNLNALSQEKGKSWEQRTTDIHFSLNNYSKEDYTTKTYTSDADDIVDWVSFKQQFFTTIIEKENGLRNVRMKVESPEDNDTIHSKYFEFDTPIVFNGELNEQYTWHFLPLEFTTLKNYNKDFETIIPFGWGIFGWINEWIILPTFRFMAGWGIQYGWVIALLTIFIKLITSPIMYRQYKQSAMMRVLKPDMDELSKKYPKKDDAMKKQQEVMALYRTAGVNPLAGCLPALLQIPIFYALFNFFPNVIDLRGKSFLWADDLTAYDSILELGFNIPFYGAHISLFALLYVITMVIYFRTSGSMMQAPTQEGMPDMRIIMYLMPVMFIFFLNSYASGLSWYYFVSNALNIGLVFVIKTWMIDDKKIHKKIEANKAKPKKKKRSKWALKLDEAMKQAQAQQELEKKKKKSKK